MDKQAITIFWFRRDLRLHDNAGLYRALNSGNPVLGLFIFDKEILNDLEDKDDARVSFIHENVDGLKKELEKHHSSLIIKYDKPESAFKEIIKEYNVAAVYTNRDYEPYAKERDSQMAQLLKKHDIDFKDFKDQVIFDNDEVLKDDKKPYTVFTPYKNKWLHTLKPFYLKSYPTDKYFKNLFHTKPLKDVSLKEMGFVPTTQKYPPLQYKKVIDNYVNTRNYPAIEGTSHADVHLRFGTLSIRELATEASKAKERTWLNELIWREFYMMVLNHFPDTMSHAYRPEYDRIKWRNNEAEFKLWCEGKTGYPLVDAGMREINATGFMHNRVRMVVASFLVKHLLIDWRWGEHYFARHLLDYEASSNVGNWQWVAGSGTDTMPYFRIFNPEAQLEKFDKKLIYVKKWVPEYGTDEYPEPMVDNREARDRCLKVYKAAVAK
ncbi:cryptochrome/photolyase family protein [Mucilaginibacter ginkgonis]|uniref:Deoxyribodipyrimidine photo-lyase n=1 Tax=Mucilaginibacter ginkgonis TaxID=2682091 RepID=A0A6I4IML6_9SPHI|nr:deoxyribodipyrimidine photo-lyase [Mucilaginibacter ginkgonis]QQL50096.1 deoxyribodipyrimidine photo-lyase [Mucilaginibacter ginkgonis]